MDNSPEKDSKQNLGKSKKPRGRKRMEETTPRENPAGSAERDLERTAATYDQAIKDYENYYQQQRTSYHRAFQNDPYYYSYHYSPSEYSYTKQLADKYEPVLVEYEEILQSMEQAMADFNTSLRYIQDSEVPQREEYVREWKEYLQSLLEISKQLANSIEESIHLISQKTS